MKLTTESANSSRSLNLELLAALVVCVIAASAMLKALLSLPCHNPPRPASDVILGAYTGPAAKGVNGLAGWEQWSGKQAPYALDFAAAQSWEGITGADWSLAPWRDAGRRLIYSVPLFPEVSADSAESTGGQFHDCARGKNDDKWTTLAQNLVAYRLANTIVRPGWEFNNSWYAWSATGRQREYIACFRHVATAMRQVPGQKFQFLWNPAIGVHEFPAEQAYPGDEFVDYLGVDVYDKSWAPGTYPYPEGVSDRQREVIAASVWHTTLSGERGLRFWATFAADRGKRLAIPEWGLSEREDGHGGGDNPAFIRNMLDFVRNPDNGVSIAMYFDAETPKEEHRMSADISPFPRARTAYHELMEASLCADTRSGPTQSIGMAGRSASCATSWPKTARSPTILY